MTTPATTTKQPSKVSIIFAGEEFFGQDESHPQIKLLDGSSVPVRVRAMPARHLGQVMGLATQQSELIDFVCYLPKDIEGGEIAGFDKVPQGWADNLTDESHALLWEAAKRLNFTRAAKWAEQQIAAKKFAMPIEMQSEEVMRPLLKMTAGLIASSLGVSGSSEKPTTRSSTATRSTS